MKTIYRLFLLWITVGVVLALTGCGAVTAFPTDPAVTPVSIKPSEISPVEWAILAVESLDQSNGFSYELHSKALTRIKITKGDEILSDGSFMESMADQGTRVMQGNQIEIALKRNISYPGSNNYPLNGEMRLVDGQIFARGAFNQPKADLPVMPNGWITVHGKSSLLYWPSFQELVFGLALQDVREDAWSLVSSYPAQTLDEVLSEYLAAVEQTDLTLPDGSPAIKLTFIVKSSALKQTIRYLTISDEVNERALDSVQDSPIQMQFTINELGQLLQWELAINFDVEDLSLTGISGFEDGSLLDGRFEQYISVKFQHDPSPGAITPPDGNDITGFREYPGLEDFDVSLNRAIVDGTSRSFIKELSSAHGMPVVFGDLAVFLYQGEAQTVDWAADWSYSRPHAEDVLEGSDLWMHTVRLPANARLEYQIRVDGQELALDPLNPNVEVGGLGSKSVVEMPGYTPPEFLSPHPEFSNGTLTEDITLSSQPLGYAVNYRVYTPAGYAGLQKLPVIYVTDGQDFLAFGKMAEALDYLIATGRIQPVMAVFIDPRDVKTGKNQRDEQFFDNPAYGEFITEELVPEIDRTYRANPTPEARLIIGTSNGGYHSLYFALHHSDRFQLVTAFSPSIWHNPEIIETYRQTQTLPLKFFISTGVFQDNDYHARPFQEMLRGKGYELLYVESNEGHSYGNWRGKFDEMLEFFFPAVSD